MRFETRARQIGSFRPMPVIARYQMPRDGLHADSAFADAIIAKYKASEEGNLPSADFAYPEKHSEAADTMDRLSTQLITLNRIRVQMNVYNQKWLHQYALSLTNSCRMLLRQLNIRGSASSGQASQSSVHELEKVLGELRTSIEEKSAGRLNNGPAVQEIPAEQRNITLQGYLQHKEETERGSSGIRSAEANEEVKVKEPSSAQEQEEIILRILTAASRGNGTRERYMSQLYKRLYESGRNGQGNRMEILDRAGTELLSLGSSGNASTPMMNGWASEAARRFYWRVQRAPRQEQKLLLQAGGYGTVISLERALRSMDGGEFRRFSMELVERMQQVTELSGLSDAMWTREGSSGIEQQIQQISSEEWTVLTELLEKEGYFFTDDGIVFLEEEDIPTLASEQARQLFWRIQRAPEQERQFFLEAGGFSSMQALENVLRTMDDVKFRRFSAQILERLHSFVDEPGHPGAVMARQLLEKMPSANGQGTDVSQTQGPASENRMLTQRQTFLRQLHAGDKTARVLEKVLRTVVEQRQTLTENTQVFDMLSDAVLNMTMDDWRTFRTEITNIEEADIPEGVDLSFLQTGNTADREVFVQKSTKISGVTSTEAASQRSTGASSRQGAEVPSSKDTELTLAEEGIRMSREKRELIQRLRSVSHIPDSSIRTLERFLREHTVLRTASPAEEGQHYFQKLTTREQENWHSFITDVLSVGNGSGSASIPSEQMFHRVHTGPGGALLAMLQESRNNAERAADTALNTVERLREERVLTGEVLAREQERRATAGSADTIPHLLQRAAASDTRNAAGQGTTNGETTADGAVLAYGSERQGTLMTRAASMAHAASIAHVPSPDNQQDLELASARMEVPRRADSTQQETSRSTKREERSESVYQDIEFETTSYHTQEHNVQEVAQSLGNVMNRLDQQQKQIERLESRQQSLEQHNVSREVLKKLDDRAQMERLRGGR